MSVNYECKVVQGWKIPKILAPVINEITGYKYEDHFHRCNAYSDYNEYIYFGEEIYNIPCGCATPITNILYEAIKDTIIDNNRIDPDVIRQELAGCAECYECVAQEPNIYILCCVL
jgi:hypothetical protein